MWNQNILLKSWFHYGPFIGTKPCWLILLMAEHFAPVEVGSLSHYLEGFMHPGWLAGDFSKKISENISEVSWSPRSGDFLP